MQILYCVVLETINCVITTGWANGHHTLYYFSSSIWDLLFFVGLRIITTKRVIGMGKVLAILFALKYCGENIRNATMPDT